MENTALGAFSKILGMQSMSGAVQDKRDQAPDTDPDTDPD
jgi:hypothetical protein